jgi:hypothetical protein
MFMGFLRVDYLLTPVFDLRGYYRNDLPDQTDMLF